MSSQAGKTNENSSNSSKAVATSLPKQQSSPASAVQGMDTQAESSVMGTMQEMANNSPRVKQLRSVQQMADNRSRPEQLAPIAPVAGTYTALWHKAVQRQADISDTVQRMPMPSEEFDKEYTDSKHTWLRMRPRADKGESAYELLDARGAPTNLLMVHERLFDQYRESKDGVNFDPAVRPFFMEDLNGNAEISDDEPLESYAGEYGVGYRLAYRKRASIKMSGLISCIGFILESENSAFACHILVTGGVPKVKAVLQDQVNALVARYNQFAGENVALCRLIYDGSTYQDGPPEWLNWLHPTGVDLEIEIARGDIEVKISGNEKKVGEADEEGDEGDDEREDVKTVMWRGDPIRY